MYPWSIFIRSIIITICICSYQESMLAHKNDLQSRRVSMMIECMLET